MNHIISESANGDRSDRKPTRRRDLRCRIDEVAILCLLSLFAVLPVRASTVELVEGAVVAAGGITSSGSYTLAHSVGLPVVGESSAGSYEIIVGLWSFAGNPTVGVEPEPVPATTPFVTQLNQNRPNPFNPVTTIGFELAGAPDTKIPTRLSIYDVSGRLVKELVDDALPPGRYEVAWDGRDTRDRQVASGVYFGRLLAKEEAFTIRLVALK